jgi:hypothetical protein
LCGTGAQVLSSNDTVEIMSPPPWQGGISSSQRRLP